MEKRLVVAVLLSIGVLYAYSFFFPPPKQVAPNASPAQQLSQPAVSAAPGTAAAPAPSAPAPVAAVPQATAAKEVVVDTDLYQAVFSTQGAGLKRVVLKKYKETPGPQGKDVVLLDEANADRFAFLTESRELGIAPGALFNASADSVKLTDGKSGTLEFTTKTPQGIVFRKVFSFSGNQYRIGLTEEIQNAGAAKTDGVLHLVQHNRVVEHKKEGRYEVHGPSTLVGEKLTADKMENLLKEPKAYDRGVMWSAFADKYFMDAVISEKGSIASVRLSRPANDVLVRDIASPVVSVNPGQAAGVSYNLFIGPKDLDVLKVQGSRLEEVIDYGWFAALAKPLVKILKYLYQYTHNYGIAIIIITVVLKVLFFPLTQKSYKSMKEMQKLQPKMTELREKYKNDRDRMNREVMELYKTHKVNPMGGCLPMLVQIPVFFALYRALMYSIELRHAPFMLWITDLSAKDPYYVTPIIMGVTMFIQQKMTPTNMDPVQAKMMLALPVVFTFMFLNFPSGLVIYWLVNNVLTIAQQAYINKTTA
ncbi:membrane protein insertase YidC [Geomonas sp. RF6]|uniref:membrane protein insertase YidC n=1 Tax=Geomonas sp. RF6 TaxID=2897342 RepID=UPI001E31791B|nr:membrane protein insertase YidC [Geomonas sp. RF6]UFS72181.1 membrane protein insertase YidC [Geomonas sp. RF6]